MPVSRLPLVVTALIAACALLPLAASADPFQPGSGKAGERALPVAATGKPFTVRADGACVGSSCLVDFGKKANKTRTVTAINCGLSSNNGQMQLGSVFFDDVQGVFIPVLSRAVDGTTEVAIAAWAEPITVPAGERLRILLASFGAAQAGVCNIQGFTE
ncbi:hypothetical protein RUR49_23560 [Pseudoxanthobacter sp. M-2]|uniref:hypothetical protein n=1 Tax=Pseudoxanthobacter sp. M-2 TaxID=3078754 RepID=UPI0038FC7F3E